MDRRHLLRGGLALGGGLMIPTGGSGAAPLSLEQLRATTRVIRQAMRTESASAQQFKLAKHIGDLDRAAASAARTTTQTALRIEQAAAMVSLASAFSAAGDAARSRATAAETMKLTRPLQGSRAADIAARARWHNAYLAYHVDRDYDRAERMAGQIVTDEDTSAAVRMLGACLLAKLSAQQGHAYRAHAWLARADLYGKDVHPDNEWGIHPSLVQNWTGATLALTGNTEDALSLLTQASNQLHKAHELQRLHTYMDLAEAYAANEDDAAVSYANLAHTLAVKHGAVSVQRWRVVPFVRRLPRWADTQEARELTERVLTA